MYARIIGLSQSSRARNRFQEVDCRYVGMYTVCVILLLGINIIAHILVALQQCSTVSLYYASDTVYTSLQDNIIVLVAVYLASSACVCMHAQSFHSSGKQKAVVLAMWLLGIYNLTHLCHLQHLQLLCQPNKYISTSKGYHIKISLLVNAVQRYYACNTRAKHTCILCILCLPGEATMASERD